MNCPTCTDQFDSEQGMRIHHAKQHGRSLPNRTCKDCGAEFYDPKSRLSYCEECEPNSGSNNGNWTDARVTTNCVSCSDEFRYYPSNKPGKYCPDCVKNATEFLGEAHVEPADRIQCDCEQCGSSMRVLRSRLEGQGVRFCSRDCHHDWMSENRVGENHHQWEGGQIQYGGRWWSVRRQALERDDHRCQHCGLTRKELGQEPDVHHLQRVRQFDDPQQAHRLDNVVCLCRPCHRLVEDGSIPVPDSV